jgi:hypothetical protein
MAIFFNFVTAPYTPQGGTEKSAVPRISPAMLFFTTAYSPEQSLLHTPQVRSRRTPSRKAVTFHIPLIFNLAS